MCNNTGYKSRVGLFELMIINDEIRDQIMSNVSTDQIRKTAQGYGMTTLRDSGINFVHEGITTLDEIVRETILDA